MTDAPQPPLDLKRLELVQTMLQDELKPYLDGATKSREFAQAFAKQALQHAFILNGGALVAFPPFARLTSAAFQAHGRWALAAFICFVLGLLFSALATYFAYSMLHRDFEAIISAAKVIRGNHYAGLVPDAGAKDLWLKHAHGAGLDFKAADKRTDRRRRVAVTCWFLALAMFVLRSAAASILISAV